MSTTIYVFTRNSGGKGAWSRYTFPFDVEHFAQLGNDLYIRHGDYVSRVDASLTTDQVGDTHHSISGNVQWPWLDFGSPAQTKMLESFDIVASGVAQPLVSFGYNPNNQGQYTAAYTVSARDSTEGNPIPIPISAPCFSARVQFTTIPWTVLGLNLHVHDVQPASA